LDLKIEKQVGIVNEINSLKSNKDSVCLADIMIRGKLEFSLGSALGIGALFTLNEGY
jgi:hypothetical protein